MAGLLPSLLVASLRRSRCAAAVALAFGCGAAAAQQPAAETLPVVTVSGRAEPADAPVSFPEFGGLAADELPVSISTLRARQLRDEGATSLSQAIRRDPSASDAYNTIGYVESIQLRGYALDPLLNYRRNGLPVSAYTPFSLVTKQQVDIQKGLNGVVTGPSSPGGTVNFVTKRATIDIAEASVDLGERGSWLAAADFGRRVSDDFGYRINVGHGQRRPAARDADGEQTVVGAALDWRGPAGIQAEAEFEVFNSRQISVPGFGLLDSDGDGVAETLPAPIDPRVNLNGQPWSQPFDSRSRVGTAKVVVPVAEQWTLTFSGLLQRTKTNDRLAFPDGCSAGEVYLYPGFCGDHQVDIYDYRSDNERRHTRVGDVALDGRVQLAGVTHRLRVAPRTTRYSERLPAQQAYNWVGLVDARAPTALPADPTLSYPNTDRDLRIDDVQVSDTVDLGERWRLFAGARFIRYQAASWRSDGTTSTRVDQRAATPWLALTWRYAPDSLVYLSASQGFEPDAVPSRATLYVNAGQVLPVERSRQIELGWRGRPTDAQTLSVAVYEIRRPQWEDREVAANAQGATLERVAGGREARHRGVEFDWSWRFASRWTASAQGALIDAEFSRSLDPALGGKRPTNVPKAAGALQLDWRQAGANSLAVSNRVYYSGERAVTSDNSVTLPSWWQWDAWLTVPLAIAGVDTRWRAGIDNITDRRYWREAPTQSWGGTYLYPAQPRTYRIGVSVLL